MHEFERLVVCNMYNKRNRHREAPTRNSFLRPLVRSVSGRLNSSATFLKAVTDLALLSSESVRGITQPNQGLSEYFS